MKVAICLVVKNEQVEIPYWIAWYKALGVDSFIIYNDFSDDNTENVILSLRAAHDIRYARNASNFDFHNVRQVRCYNDAVQRYGSEFDWIAFFDADEYLDLYGQNIHDYLSGFQDADLVSINWCCAGTNGFVSRPEGAPFLKYRKHARQELRWNRHTKFFLRPLSLTEEITQVHHAYVKGNVVGAAGETMSWTTRFGGFATDAPTWQGARLIHYQSRSLEHYVKRDKTLEERRRNSTDPLQEVTKNPEYNEIEIPLDSSQIDAFYNCMSEIINAQASLVAHIIATTPEVFFSQLRSRFKPGNERIFDPVYSWLPHEIEHKMISPFRWVKDFTFDRSELVGSTAVFTIEGHLGKTLVVRPDGVLSGNQNGEKLYVVCCPKTGYAHFCAPDGYLLKIGEDPRLAQFLTYRFWQSEDGRLFFLHPRTRQYLCLQPDGNCVASRKRPFEWEAFKSVSIDVEMCPPHVAAFAQSIERNQSFQEMQMSCRRNGLNSPVIFNLITSLDDESKKALSILSGGILLEHLM